MRFSSQSSYSFKHFRQHFMQPQAIDKCAQKIMLIALLVICLLAATACLQNSRAVRRAGAAELLEGGKRMRNSIGIEFVQIPAGSFRMGSDGHATINHDEVPARIVTFKNPFYLGKYEVSQAEWQYLMGYNPSEFEGENLPVDHVSWDDAQRFVGKLNELGDGYWYFLPSEAQWEYAARAGEPSEFIEDIDAVAWHENNAEGTTHEVGTKSPNAWGLHDMYGNVYEWCEDFYDSYERAPSDGNARRPPPGAEHIARVVRGRSWDAAPKKIRAAYRGSADAGERNHFIGLRIVAVPRG